MNKSKHTIAVPHTRREPTSGGGSIWVEDPATQEMVLVEIDAEGIAREYGPRACLNKSRKSRQLNGLVKIIAL